MAENTSLLNILVRVRDEATSALSRLSNEVSEVGGSLNWLSNKAGIAAAALSGIGLVGLGFAINQAREAATEWKKIEIILRGTGVTIDDIKKRAEKMAEASIFRAYEIGNVYAKNIALFGDTSKAIEKTKLAMDIAAISGMDLTQAQKMISRASDENLMALRRLAETIGVKLPTSTLEGIDKGEQFNLILQKIQERVRGADEELIAMDGFRLLRKNLAELAQIIGEVLLPVINSFLKDHVIPIIKGIKAWAEAHPGLFNKIVLAAGALTGFMAVLAPILFALPRLITLFRGVAAVVGFLATPLGIAISLLSLMAVVVYNTRDAWFRAWQSIKDFFIDVYNKIKAGIDVLVGAYNNLVNILSTPIKMAGNFLGNVGSAIGNFFKFQEGGIVTRPTIGLLGEAGAEAVIPLNRLGGTGVGGGVTINLYGDFFTDADIARRFGEALAKEIKYQLKL